MKYQVFVVNPIQENTYIVWDEPSGEAAIIDAGMWQPSECRRIAAFIAQEKLTLRYALQTHTHFDHIFGLGFIQRQYGLAPCCHSADVGNYLSQPAMMRDFGMDLSEPLPSVGRTLHDGETLHLGTASLRVIHTPGHTPGGVCYYAEGDGLLFCGDTLFQSSIGRTDLPGGNMAEEIQSIRQKLFVLPDETTALPGHGQPTNIGWEKQNNLYV